MPDSVFSWPEPGVPLYEWRPDAGQLRWLAEHDPEHRYMSPGGRMTDEWHRERGRRWSAAGYPSEDHNHIYYCPQEEVPAWVGAPDPRAVLRDTYETDEFLSGLRPDGKPSPRSRPVLGTRVPSDADPPPEAGHATPSPTKERSR